MSFENNTIERIILGDASTYPVLSRTIFALKAKGITSEDIDALKRNFSKAITTEDRINVCIQDLEKIGYKWGERQLNKEERTIEAVFSGKYDDTPVGELIKLLKLDRD